MRLLKRFHFGRPRSLPIVLALALVASALVLLATVVTPAEAALTDGTLTVNVKRDFNNNGLWDELLPQAGATSPATAANRANEPGAEGIVVEVYDAAGNLRTATTNASGVATFAPDSTLTGGKYRVEVSIPSSMSYLSPVHVDKASTSPNKYVSHVEFVDLSNGANKSILTGVWNPSDWDDANPRLVTTVNWVPSNAASNAFHGVASWLYSEGPIDGSANAVQSPGSSAAGGGGTNGVPDAERLAQWGEVGSTWGVAGLDSQRAFVSAANRWGMAIGPKGRGAIYLLSLNDPVAIDLNKPLFTTINLTNNAFACPSPSGTSGSGPTGACARQAFYNAIGKSGLGDIDLSEDRKTLYVVNVGDKQLIEVPIIRGPGNTITAGTQKIHTIPMPAGTCNSEANFWPWGLGVRDGKVFVGAVCTSEGVGTGATATAIATAPTNLKAIIQTVDASNIDFSTATLALNSTIPLSRDTLRSGAGPTQWFGWTSNLQSKQPAPIVSDIDFAENGDLTLGITSRVSLQQQPGVYGWDGSITGNDDVDAGGDVVRACKTSATTWVYEQTTGCMVSRTKQGGTATEWWSGEMGGTLVTPLHYETALGGITTLLGKQFMVTTAVDPVTQLWRQGTLWLDKGTGWKASCSGSGFTLAGSADSACGGIELMQTSNDGDVGKGNGIGDISVMSEPPPIQIGNYVWFDADRDGIQDPNETPIAGVTVRLYSETGTLLGTTTTDARGEYYFDTATNGLQANTVYYVSVDRAEDRNAGGPLAGYAPTVANTGMASAEGADANDSDGVFDATAPLPNPTRYPLIKLTTADWGQHNHTYDFGFNLPVPRIDIEKVDDAGNDADTPQTAVAYPAGTSRTINFTIANNGTEDLSQVRVTDQTVRGGTVTAMSCTFPGAGSATSGVLAGTTWTVTWSATFGANPTALFAAGASFPCTATLTMNGSAQPHADVASVSGVGAGTGTTVTDQDAYHAYTGAVQIIKYDARNGYTPPVAGGIPTKPLADTAVDANSDPVRYDVATGAPNTGPQPVKFTVTNSGATYQANVVVTDSTVSGPNLQNISCTFPDNSTGTTWAGPWAPGNSFVCTATLTLTPGSSHEDTVKVDSTVMVPTPNPAWSAANPTAVDPFLPNTPNVSGGNPVLSSLNLTDNDPFKATASSSGIGIEKVDAQNQDADTPQTAVAYAPGTSRTINFTITNPGSDALRSVVVTDKTVTGGSVTAMSCTFPGGVGSTPGTFSNGTWTVTWAATFTTPNPTLFAAGASFPCTATLTMSGDAAPHADVASVDAVVDRTGGTVRDDDAYHAFTGAVQIIKYDGRNGYTAPLDANGLPVKPLANSAADANTAPGVVYEIPQGASTTGPQPVHFVVTNMGKTYQTNVVISDTTTTGPNLQNISCTFPDNSTGTTWAGPWAPGNSFVCTAQLTLTTAADVHADTVKVDSTVMVPTPNPAWDPTNPTATNPFLPNTPNLAGNGTPVASTINLTDNDPYNATVSTPGIGIEKVDADGNDADAPNQAVAYTPGSSKTITLTISNDGSEALRQVVVTDKTVTGGSVTAMSCTFPGAAGATAGTFSNGTWTVRWDATFTTPNPTLFAVGASFPCTATLTMSGDAAPHADVASVDAVVDRTGTALTDSDGYHAFTGDVQIIKYDGRNGYTAPVDGNGLPVKPLANDTVDANDAPGVEYEIPTGSTTTGPQPVHFVVTNTGTTFQTGVSISDSTTTGPDLQNISCTFPDNSTGTTWAGPWAPGASFVCTADLTLSFVDDLHADVAKVDSTVMVPSPNPAWSATNPTAVNPFLPNTPNLDGNGNPVASTIALTDDDPFNAFATGNALSIDKVDEDGNDADIAAAAVAYEPGSSKTIDVTITNGGNEDLRQVVVTDKTVTGGSVTDMSCTFPGAAAPTAGVFANGTWTVTWAATFTTPNPTLFAAGASFPCTATLTMNGDAEPHADVASVDAVVDRTGDALNDTDAYHAFTGDVQIIKYDGRDGYTAPVDANGLPIKPLADADVDANTAPGASYEVDPTTGNTGPQPVHFVVTNTGTTFQTGVSITDSTTTGPNLQNISCTFPDNSTGTTWAGPWAPGDSFVCTAELTLTTAALSHADTVKVDSTVMVPASNPAWDPANPTASNPFLPDTPNLDGNGNPVASTIDLTDDDPFHAVATTPKLDMEKADADGNDADAPDDAVAYEPGSSKTIDFTITNSGSEDLHSIVVTDRTISGGSVTDLSCTFPGGGAPTAGTFANGVWTVRWEASFATTNPAVFAAGADFPCTATLTMNGDAAPHSDMAGVTGKVVGTDTELSDTDGYHAFTGDVQIIKYDGRNGYTAPVDADGLPVKPLANDTVDANDAPGIEYEIPTGATTTGPQPVHFVVTNMGTTFQTDVVISDSTTTGPDLQNISCTFPDNSTGSTWAGPWAPGDSFVCTATVTLTDVDDLHADVAKVDSTVMVPTPNPAWDPADPTAANPFLDTPNLDGNGDPVASTIDLTDDDPFNAFASKAELTIEKADEDGNDADGPADAVAYEPGSSKTIDVTITNGGNEALRQVVVTDQTVTGGSVTAMSCTFPGDAAPTAGTFANGTWTVRWDASFATPNPTLFAADGAFDCTATLTMNGDAEPHADVATVDAVVDRTGEALQDDDGYHAFTGDVQIIKYDGRNGYTAPADGDGLPVKPLAAAGVDANTAPGVTYEIPQGSTTTGPQPVHFVVTNTGKTFQTDVVIADSTTTGPDLQDISCTFPDASTGTTWAGPWTPGDSFVCTATITLTGTARDHADIAKVDSTVMVPTTNPAWDPANPTAANPFLPDTPNLDGNGDPVASTIDLTDDDPYNATVSTPDLGIEKADADGNDADTPDEAVGYEPGSSKTIEFTITNSGSEDLHSIAVTDRTISGGSVTDLSCTFPGGGAPTAGTFANGTWTVRWDASFATPNPAVFAAGADFPCTATLTMNGDAAPHSDVAGVTGKVVGTDTELSDTDGYHAFTGDVQIIKYDGRNGYTAPVDADGLPIKPLAATAVDANTAPGVEYDIPSGSTTTGPQPVRFVVTNTGKTFQTGVSISDSTTTGPDLQNIACTFPDNSTGTTWAGPWAPGDSFVCTATVTLTQDADTHADVAKVDSTVMVPTPNPAWDPADPTAESPFLATPNLDGNGDPVASDIDLDDDDPFHAFASAASLAIEKVDADGNDADTPQTAVGYEPGSSKTIDVTITNGGNEALCSVVVTDQTVTGGSVTAMSCTFPGAAAPTAGTFANGTWTVRWEATFATPNPTLFAAGDDFGCTATLTMNGDAEPHADVATVDAVVDRTGDALADSDGYHAFTGDVQIIKYDGRNGYTAPLDADGLPVKPLAAAGVDANTVPGVTYEIPQGSTTTGPQPVHFVVTNTGTTFQTNVVIADSTTTGPDLQDVTCTFPDDSTGLTWAGPWAPGDSFVCTATVTLTDVDDVHADTVTVDSTVVVPSPNPVWDPADPTATNPFLPDTPNVDGNGNPVASTIDLTDDDPYHATVSTPGIGITKVDADGNDADTPETAVAYEPGTAKTIDVTITNGGSDPLRQVEVTDETVTGGSVTAMSCTFPGAAAPTAGVFANGTWTVRWEATFATPNPTLFAAGADFPCTATLTMNGDAEPHADVATVDAVVDRTGTAVTAADAYHAFTGDVQIIKYDGRNGYTAPVDADGLPTKPLANTTVDANDAPGIEYEIGAGSITTGPQPVHFVVTNMGTTFQTNVVISDSTTTGPDLENVSCTFPDTTTGTTWAGPWAPGDSFVCTATVTLTQVDDVHADIAKVDSTVMVPTPNPAWDPTDPTGTNPFLPDVANLDANGAPVVSDIDLTDDDPFNAFASAAKLSIDKVDADGNDADTATDAVAYEPGSSKTIDVTITNGGNEALRQVVVTDKTVTGGSVTAMSCTFPGAAAPTAGVFANGTWTVTWAATFTTPNPTLFAAGDDFGCTATLTMNGDAEPHADVASVDAVVDRTGAPLTDDDAYHAFTGDVQIIKYDGRNGYTAPLDADGLPVKPLAAAGVDANTAPGASYEIPQGSTTSGPQPVHFVVTNTGKTFQTGVTISDSTTTGPDLENVSCTFPDDSTGTTWAGPWAPGDSFVCTATLTLTNVDDVHADIAKVDSTVMVPTPNPAWDPADPTATNPFLPDTPNLDGNGNPVASTIDLTDDDPFNATVTTPDLGIEKADEDGNDADTPDQAVAYEPGSSKTIDLTITNSGSEDLHSIAVTDRTISGGSLTDLSCTFPGAAAPTAGTFANGVWTVRWEASFAATNPAVFAAGADFPCTATLTMNGDAAPHSDMAGVTGKVVGTDTELSDTDGYHAFTGDVQIIKYDGRDGYTAPVDADGLPVKPLADASVDANTAPGATYEIPQGGTTTGPQPVHFVVTNTGTTFQTNVDVTDATTTGPDLQNISCTFPDDSTGTTWAGPWAPGDSFVCTATVTLTPGAPTHADTATVNSTVMVPTPNPAWNAADPTATNPFLDTPNVDGNGNPVASTIDLTDDDPFNAAVATPGIDIEKADADGNDADTPTEAVAYVPGTSKTIDVAITNNGSDPLRQVVVTDKTVTGGSVTAMSCTFPGAAAPTAGTFANGTWTVRWEASFAATDPALFDADASFPCSATLTMNGDAEPHADVASVDAVVDRTGTAVTDQDGYHAFTGDVQIIKYDGRNGYTAPVDADGLPIKPLADDLVDANTAPGVAYEIPQGSTTTGPQPVHFVVTNTGTTFQTEVAITDATTTGPDLQSISCTFPDDSTGTTWAGPWAPGDSFVCTATVTLTATDRNHADLATVNSTVMVPTPNPAWDPNDPTAANPFLDTPNVDDNGNPVASAVDLTDDDPFHATVSTPDLVVEKYDEDGNDADTPGTGVAYEPGSSKTITFDIHNLGNVALHHVVVTDDTVTGGTVTDMSCTFPGDAGPTAGVLAGGTWTVTWAASGTADPVLFAPDGRFSCTATLTMNGDAEPHADVAGVEGLVAGTNTRVTDDDPYHAFTGDVQLVKFDGDGGFTPPANADGIPAKPLADTGRDANQATGARVYEIPQGAVTTGAHDVHLVATNTGTTWQTNIRISDTTTAGPEVTGLSCAFPDGSSGLTWNGPWEPGSSFTCTGQLTLTTVDSVHGDLARIDSTVVPPAPNPEWDPANPTASNPFTTQPTMGDDGQPVRSDLDLNDDDPFHATVSTPDLAIEKFDDQDEDADLPSEAVAYPAGATRTIDFHIANGPEALREVVVTDRTIAGGAVDAMACTFPGDAGPTAGVFADGTWTVTWAATFATPTPTLFAANGDFPCTATLTMDGSAAPHADRAAVTGLVDQSGTRLSDDDAYHAFTGDVQIIKYDGRDGYVPPAGPGGIPAKPLADTARDANTPAGRVEYAPEDGAHSTGPHPVHFAVTNTGATWQTDVVVGDQTTLGPDLLDVSCTFPDDSTGTTWAGPWAPGSTFYCSGTLTLVAETGDTHGDVAKVDSVVVPPAINPNWDPTDPTSSPYTDGPRLDDAGNPVRSDLTPTDNDPYHAFSGFVTSESSTSTSTTTTTTVAPTTSTTTTTAPTTTSTTTTTTTRPGTTTTTVARATPTSQPSSPPLVRTGADSTGPIRLGLLLLGAGTVLVFATRRRRTRRA